MVAKSSIIIAFRSFMSLGRGNFYTNPFTCTQRTKSQRIRYKELSPSIRHLLTSSAHLCKIHGDLFYQCPSSVEPTVAWMVSCSILSLRRTKQLMGGNWNFFLVLLISNFWEAFQTCSTESSIVVGRPLILAWHKHPSFLNFAYIDFVHVMYSISA